MGAQRYAVLVPARALRRTSPDCASHDAFAANAQPLSDAQLAALAVAALIDEAQLTPKPALVDRRGSGAHRDLDLAKMMRSAHALEPTFAALARVARGRAPSATLRAELAQIGRAGEIAMMQATGGSNAHRGAIWILGLLVAAAAMGATHASICRTAAQIACFPDRFAAPVSESNGERVRQRYRVGGARREAQDGFPHVVDVGLPALRRARAAGLPEDAARLDTLLAMMASLDDTCLLHRAGLAGLDAGRQGALRVLACGGSATTQGRAALETLERELMALNASPGGSADLLAATLFIDTLIQRNASGNPSGSAAPWNI
ncbi:triphosphoribosyl-dephospho-CoA synthase [Paraburkholderia saeva]|uniref:triphosphoribosyl-dephospho-CoA synthase n=1 Tax=Paraburkholderia saeva TaxID=2777537 RepID=UPI001DB44AC4|nr:triphosphoribosyl-dephospho-CoA synthase [Paraburkholderia saeva]CAG4908652.1 2-(5''-triphosphoribosyl)-3'-dephosphocoenzyme-A synthase [Paraburkholderia saeva]